MAVALQSKSAVIFALDRRSKDRIDVAIWSQIRTENDEESPARITNISGAGLMAMTPAPLQADQRVRIQLPEIGWVAARVGWTMGDRVGFEFNVLLEDDAFAKLAPYCL